MNINDAAERILADDKQIKIHKKIIGYIFPRNSIQITLWILLALFSGYYSYWIVCNDETTKKFSEICDLLLGVDLGLLGIVITGYAIFQAFLSQRNTIFLLQSPDAEGKITTYEEYNLCFFALAVLSCFTLIYCIISKLAVINHTFVPIFLNTSFFKIVFSTILIFLPLIVVIDMFNFIYSIYQVFSVQAALNAIEHMSKSEVIDQSTDNDNHE